MRILVLLGLLFAWSASAQELVRADAGTLLIKGVDMLARYQALQQSDGGFRQPIQTSSVLYNTQMLFLYSYLGLESKKQTQIAELFRYIWSEQNADGSFSSYPNDGGSADASLMVYLVSRLHKLATPEVKKLEAAISSQEQLQNAGSLSLPYLMLSGMDKRVNCVLPMGFKTLVKQDKKLSWLRVLMYPMLYLFQTKGVLKVDAPLLAHKGCLENKLRQNSTFKKEGEALTTWYSNHVDEIGMIFSYVPTTIPWVMALHQLKKKSPAIYKNLDGDARITLALKSMEDFQVNRAKGLYQSPGEGSVAETVEVAKLLLDSGVSAKHVVIQKAVKYLQDLQQESGGLGFSKHNRLFPDPDDTSLSLSVWQKVYAETKDQKLQTSIQNARKFMLTRPNKDGGFGDWDRAQDLAWWFKPVAKNLQQTGLVVSESAVDVTARVLLGLKGEIANSKEAEEKWLEGIKWLLDQQSEDGSYLSTWMVGYGFGTGSALAALATALGHPEVNQKRLNGAIERGSLFLQRLQKIDGAFSEDLRTYLQDKPMVAEKSSPAMTGIVLSRILMFLELAPEYRSVLQDTVTKARDFLVEHMNDEAKINDESWTAVSFPKLEYARYETIQEVEALRSLVLFEKLY